MDFNESESGAIIHGNMDVVKADFLVAGVAVGGPIDSDRLANRRRGFSRFLHIKCESSPPEASRSHRRSVTCAARIQIPVSGLGHPGIGPDPGHGPRAGSGE